MTDPSIIREAFQLIRDYAHHDVHPLVDKLERRLRVAEATIDRQARIIRAVTAGNTHHSVRADRLPDINGLDPDDPRSDGWYARKVAMWDMRERM